MTKIVQRIVHEKTIGLDEDVGLPDGQEVEVALRMPETRGGRGRGQLP